MFIFSLMAMALGVTHSYATTHLDSSFGDKGMAEAYLPPESGLPAWVKGTRQTTGGKLLQFGVVGVEWVGEETVRVGSAVARYNGEGTLDRDFASEGVLHLDEKGWDFPIEDLATFPSGDFVVCSSPKITRYKSSGEVDTSFGNAGSVIFPNSEDSMLGPNCALLIDADGSLLVSLDFYNPDGDGSTRFVHLKANGELDKTFGKQGLIRGSIIPGAANELYSRALAMRGGGYLLVGHAAFGGDFYSGVAVALLPDGKINPEFGEQGVFRVDQEKGWVNFLKTSISKSGKKIAIGYSIAFEDKFPVQGVYQLESSGKADLAFGAGGKVQFESDLYPEFSYVEIFQPDYLPGEAGDERLIMSGNFSTPGEFPYSEQSVILLRLTKDGKVDSTFGENGKFLLHSRPAREIGLWSAETEVLPDGKLLISTSRIDRKNALARTFLLYKVVP